MKKFIISSFVAAGFAATSEAQIDDAFAKNEIAKKANPDNGIQNLIGRVLPFTLARHYSHSSHGSHGSHGSHSSHGSYYKAPDILEDRGLLEQNSNLEGSGRNMNSTPPESILPRSPAIVPAATTKTHMKGSSKKFVVLTQKVQLALYAIGYYTGIIDGQLNNEMKASITKYQKNHNLKVTGSLSDGLVSNLLHVNAEIK